MVTLRAQSAIYADRIAVWGVSQASYVIAMALARYAVVKEIGFMAGILLRDRWKRSERDGESFFYPMPIIEKTPIPAIVSFGELDKNVDPIQGAAVYRAALEKAGHPRSRVVLFQKVDHDLVLCESGCMKERNRRSRWRVHPDYLDTMIEWLAEPGAPGKAGDGSVDH